jgi:hypothetical protein
LLLGEQFVKRSDHLGHGTPFRLLFPSKGETRFWSAWVASALAESVRVGRLFKADDGHQCQVQIPDFGQDAA